MLGKQRYAATQCNAYPVTRYTPISLRQSARCGLPIQIKSLEIQALSPGSCELAENPTLRAIRFRIADARLPHSSCDDDLHEKMAELSAVSKVTDGFLGLFHKDTQHDDPDWPF